MKRIAKKALALMLTVFMLMSFTSVGITAFAESSSEVFKAELTLDNSVTVPMVDGYATAAELTFVPKENGVYVFYSDDAYGSSYVYATLCIVDGENMSRLTEQSKDYNNGDNFRFGYELEAGKTYVLRIDTSEKTSETIDVAVTKSPIERIDITGNVSLYENNGGYTDSDSQGNEFYYYDWVWNQSLTYNVVFSDGYIMEYSGCDGFAYDNIWYEVESHDTQYENPWTVGNSYSVEISISGVKAYPTITIEEAPITSVVFEPLEIIEGTGGYNAESDGNRFYYYNWEEKLKYTVTMSDGSSFEGTGSSFEYNGEYFYFYNYSNQYSEPFTAGNTYTIPMSIMGKTFDAKVTIAKTPVKSIDIAQSKIELIENLDGNLQDHDPNNIWFSYGWQNCFDYTITFEDGTVIEKNDENANGIEYNGEFYHFIHHDTQYATHWNAGETHTVSFSFMGVTKDIEVEIIENPVSSITVTPVTLQEGKNGYQGSYNGNDVYIYYWIEKLEYTVNFNDGTSSSFKGSNCSYNGKDYNIRYDQMEQYESPLVAGENTVNISILGKDVPVIINVTPSPIVSFTVDPVILVEHKNGYFVEQGTPNEWFYYWFNEPMTYTVELSDGTVVNTNTSEGFMYNDEWYNVSTNINQYENHLYANNIYTANAYLDGKSTTFEISVAGEKTADGFTYLIQNGSVIITGCSRTDKNLVIPSEIEGYPVVGITGLDNNYESLNAEELTIPDSVTMISSEIFGYLKDLKVLNLGKGIKTLENWWFMDWTYELEAINISDDNPNLTSIDGIVYNEDITELVAFPPAKTGTYTVPATITNLDVLFDYLGMYNISLDLTNKPAGFIKVDGVVYNTDMTKVYICDKDKTGSYVMPDSVTEISREAFANTLLTDVIVSKNVTEIVYGTFADCLKLESVVLPESVTDIGFGAFTKCKSLTTIELPSTLEYLNMRAFAYSGIQSITIPSTVEYIGDACFKGSALEEVVISNGVMAVGPYCFSESLVKDVTLPDSVVYVGHEGFSYTPLESIKLSENLEAVNAEVFYDTKLTSITIPKSVFEIGYYAFGKCTLLKEAVILGNDVFIDEGAFYNCPLTNINLNEGIQYIGDFAFYGNNATSLKLPDSVTHITYYSFANSKNLLDIDVSDNLESLCGYAFEGSKWLNTQENGVVYLENYLYGYKGKMPKNTEITVKDGTALIANYAFEDEFNLKSISLPASLKYIGHSAFYNCFNLNEIYIDSANEHFFFENDVLYDEYGGVVWAKPYSIVEAYDLVTEFEYGEEFYLGDAYFKLLNANGSMDYFNADTGWFKQPTEEWVFGFDSKKVGTQTVTLVIGNLVYRYDVFVSAPEAVSIEIEKLPNKTEYDLDQTLRTNGMVVVGITENGAKFEISDYNISGYNASQSGEQTVTVSYGDLTAEFKVHVKEEQKTFTHETEKIEISVPKDVIEQGAEIVVEKKELENVKTEEVEIPQIFEENNTLIFDISFEKDEQEVQPDGEVQVSIPVPEGVNGRACEVYHLGTNGYEDMNAVYEDGFLVFSTSHFSYYGIVETAGVSVTGTVTSEGKAVYPVMLQLVAGEEIVDAVVSVDGTYVFENVAAGSYKLIVSKSGYETASVDITVADEQIIKDITVVSSKVPGDVDGDGNRNAADLALLKKVIAGLTPIDSEDVKNPNVDENDGTPNAADLALLKKIIAGLV